jgi:hypothetical protein
MTRYKILQLNYNHTRHGVTGNKLALRVPNITIDTLTLERVETSSSRAALDMLYKSCQLLNACETWFTLFLRLGDVVRGMDGSGSEVMYSCSAPRNICSQRELCTSVSRREG